MIIFIQYNDPFEKLLSWPISFFFLSFCEFLTLFKDSNLWKLITFVWNWVYYHKNYLTKKKKTRKKILLLKTVEIELQNENCLLWNIQGLQAYQQARYISVVWWLIIHVLLIGLIKCTLCSVYLMYRLTEFYTVVLCSLSHKISTTKHQLSYKLNRTVNSL